MSECRFRLAVCQIRTRKTREETLIRAEKMVREAAMGGASVVVLPEMFFCPYRTESFPLYAETADGPSLRALSRWASDYQVILIGGSIPERDGERLYNSCFVFDRDGSLLARHRKAHLFDIDLPDNTFRESDTFTAGGDYCVFDTDLGRMAVAICFDLRFPEYLRGLARRGAEVILLPAQFTASTGKAHWELLCRARALDNQLYLVGAEAARDPDGPFQCWGHSIIVSPFGEILSEAGEDEEILFADLDLGTIDGLRKQLPVFDHLKEDLYPVNEGFSPDL